MKPCEQTCPKCGGNDNHRQHHHTDTKWRYGSPIHPALPWKSDFLSFEGSYATALKECVSHHCRTCQFDWETAPLSEAVGKVIGVTISNQLGNTHKVQPPYKLEGLVGGLLTRVEFQDGALIVDLDQPNPDDQKGFHGPRLFISRAMDDGNRKGWRVLVHPDDGDPHLCVFARDDGTVEQWNSARQESHWPGGI